MDEELDELGLYLPSEDNLWSASTHEEWFQLANSTDKENIMGMPIREALHAFLSGGKDLLPRFDALSSFLIIHGLVRAIHVYFISGLHDQQRYRVKQALNTWSQQRLQLLHTLSPAEATVFKWTGLFIYMLAVVVHDDTTRLVSYAEKNFDLFAGWIEEIPDTISGNKRIKATCAAFRASSTDQLSTP